MKRLGKQKPRYVFFLNPYTHARFTSCPQCGAKTRQRKLPLVIYSREPAQMTALNKTCRFCPACDLLIAHANELSAFFAQYFGVPQAAMTSDDYLVVGTMDRGDWVKGPSSPDEMLATLHDFKRVVTFEPAPTWLPAPRE